MSELEAKVPGAALALAILLTLGFALRLGLALALPNIHWPDEIFQTVEQAHRLVFGYGIVPWEFRDGIRSFLFPGFLAGLMGLTQGLGPGAWGYTIGISAALVALSLLPALCAYLWTRRCGCKSPAASLVSVVVVLAWPELVHFADKPLTEAVAAHLLVPALYLLAVLDERRSIRRPFIIGVLLGLVIVLRMHLGPPLLVLVAVVLWRRPRRQGLSLLGGFLGMIFCAGLLDLATWGVPFASFYRSFRINILLGKSHQFGVFPLHQYLEWIGSVWAWGLPPILALLVLGWRRLRTPMLLGLGVLVLHSIIDHKEYRFCYPAIVLFIFCAAVEAGRVVDEAITWRPGRFSSGTLPALAMVLWIALGLSLAPRLRAENTGNRIGGGIQSHFEALGGVKDAFLSLSQQPEVCGVALVGLPWSWSGGYAYLHQPVPLYLIQPGEGKHIDQAHYNVIVARLVSGIPPPFQRRRCRGHTCIYQRPGSCRTNPGYDINQVLKDRGE